MVTRTSVQVQGGGRPRGPFHRTRWAICLVILALGKAVTVLMKPALASPTATPTPASGPPEATITLTGRGWDSGLGDGSIYLSQDDVGTGSSIGSFAPGRDGTFTTTFVVPRGTHGFYTMVACQLCGDPDSSVWATFFFQVIPTARATPASGLPGATITLTGEGWDPGIEGLLYVSQNDVGTSSTIGSFTPGEDGTFTAPLTVPDVPKGPYTMVACQRCGDPDGFPEATFRFQVTALKPSVTASPASGLPGATITLTGQGWDPGIEGAIYQTEAEAGTGSPIGSFTPGQDGSFTETFTVPQIPKGAYTLVACQLCGDPDRSVRATFPFQVTALKPTATATPASGLPGATITLTGQGWDARLGQGAIFVSEDDVATGLSIGSFTPGDDHSFTTTFKVPEVPTGPYTMVACQQCGNPDSSVRAPFTFQVAAIVGSGTLDLTPSSGRQGDRIQVGGRGWSLAGGVVRIYVNPTTPISGDPDAEVLPSAEGTFETLFLVPRLARGSYTVLACQHCGAPDRIEMTRTLAIAGTGPQRIPGPALYIGLLILIGGGLLGRAIRARRLIRLQAERLRITMDVNEPGVVVTEVRGGSSPAPRHTVRLVPYPDRGVQQLQEVNTRDR